MPGCSYVHGSDGRSIPDIARFWIDAGGDVGAAAVMTAIALAESAGYADAVSVDCAIGLWQILADHATEQGIAVSQLYRPSVNAQFAVSLSFNGTALAPWDTAYASEAAAAQRYPLSQLEAGSPAAGFYSSVYDELVTAGVITPSGGIGPGGGPISTGRPPGSGHDPNAPISTYTLPIPPVIAGGPFPGFPAFYVPAASGSGWENVRQWLGPDQVAVHELLQLVQNTLSEATRGQ